MMVWIFGWSYEGIINGGQLLPLTFFRRYWVSTIIEPSEVQMSYNMALLVGTFVMLKMAYSLKEFLRYF